MEWTRVKPTEVGWYWCRNDGDHPGEIWEAIVRLDVVDDILCCTWLTAPGIGAILRHGEWSDFTQWAGPIEPPSAGEVGSEQATR